jgi:hypothetical protein
MRAAQAATLVRLVNNHNDSAESHLRRKHPMRNQIIHTMASALLCVSGFAQTADISEEVPIINLQSTGDTVGWITTFAGDFEGAWKNVTEPSRIDGRTTGCAPAGSRLLDIISKNRYGRQSREVPVWQLPASHDFFFISGMTIDADGAPNAYNPDNTGLDDLDNAGAPGRWDGIVADRSGNALFQQRRSLPWLLHLVYIPFRPN